MKHLLGAALAVAVLFAPAARAAPPSLASVEELLQLTQADKTLDTMYGQMEQAMQQGMVQALGRQPLTPAQQKIFEAMPREFSRILREEMGWSALRPDFVTIYRETFDQDEVDGLIAFYKSPVGRAFIEKTPVVMQKSMAVSQNRMQAILPRLQAAMQKAVADIKAAK